MGYTGAATFNGIPGVPLFRVRRALPQRNFYEALEFFQTYYATNRVAVDKEEWSAIHTKSVTFLSIRLDERLKAVAI